jgi:hypothetical protein
MGPSHALDFGGVGVAGGRIRYLDREQSRCLEFFRSSHLFNRLFRLNNIQLIA